MKPRADTALILGVSGQDGAYVADLLVKRGLKVHGTSRDKEISSFANLREQLNSLSGAGALQTRAPNAPAQVLPFPGSNKGAGPLPDDR